MTYAERYRRQGEWFRRAAWALLIATFAVEAWMLYRLLTSWGIFNA